MEAQQKKTDVFNEMADLLTPSEVSAFMRCSIASLARNRRFKRGLPFVKYNRRVFYRKQDVIEFIENNLKPISN